MQSADKFPMEAIPAAEMMPIPLNDLIAGSKLPLDLYIRLNDDKFILMRKAGLPVDTEQMKTYQEKEVAYLWVRKKEYYKITHQSITIAGIVINSATIEAGQKTKMLSRAAGTVFNEFAHMGFSLEVYSNVRQIVDATFSLAETHKDLAALFESFKDCGDHFVAHSMGVSILAVQVAQEMGWTKKMTLEKLALAGLLHDIGLKCLPPDLIQKSIGTMTPQEFELYQTHVSRGVEILHSLGIVPDDVISMVNEHHENAIGQGYPQHIRDIKMHPMAKVIALCDHFMDLVIANPNNKAPKNSREAVMYIEHAIGQPYNKEAFKALKRLIEGGKTVNRIAG